MQFEGFVGVVFPDDALGVVLLDPVLTGLRQLDLHHTLVSSTFVVAVAANVNGICQYTT